MKTFLRILASPIMLLVLAMLYSLVVFYQTFLYIKHGKVSL